MEKSDLMTLDLRTSLFYEKVTELPKELTEQDEFLLCYGLNPEQSSNFEPDPSKFIDSLVFYGQKTVNQVDFEKVELPIGKYLFIQYRMENQPSFAVEDWLNLAIEQQKDCLWERNQPGTRLYIRFLYEDGRWVTQFLRDLA